MEIEYCQRVLNKRLPIEIKKELDKYIVGQTKYKETMAMNIYRHYYKGIVSPTLVQGPTGSGKTYMFKLLPAILDKFKLEGYTIMTTNISRLTEEGVKGQDLDEIFVEFKERCLREHNTEFRGSIYVDEIDKIISPFYISTGVGEVNRNSLIQHQLMQILDGGNIAGCPTRNILFVFGGAFHQIDNIKKYESKHNPIGFESGLEPKERIMGGEFLREQLIEIGFQREFIGRISQIVKLEALKEKELTAILMHPTRGVVSKLSKEFAFDGIELQIKNEAINGLVKQIVKENLGARSCQNILEKILNGAYFHCLEKDYNCIVIDEETLSSGEIKYRSVVSTEKGGIRET